MATVKFLYGAICLIAFSWGSLPGSNLLSIARAEIGVREATNRNDGARVEEYLAAVGLKKGDKYCAAYVSWCFKKAGYLAPRTGWCPALFPKDRLVKEPFPGCVFGLYFPSLKRIAHVGFVERIRGKYCVTIEGNTNPEGSREGGGVFRRMRYRKTISKYANWL